MTPIETGCWIALILASWILFLRCAIGVPSRRVEPSLPAASDSAPGETRQLEVADKAIRDLNGQVQRLQASNLHLAALCYRSLAALPANYEDFEDMAAVARDIRRAIGDDFSPYLGLVRAEAERQAVRTLN